jgi:hypothetical protein
MATDIVVPTLGESVSEATVAQWLKQPGQAVSLDEPQPPHRRQNPRPHHRPNPNRRRRPRLKPHPRPPHPRPLPPSPAARRPNWWCRSWASR